MKSCSRCGNEKLIKGVKYCLNCGADVEKEDVKPCLNENVSEADNEKGNCVVKTRLSVELFEII